MNARDTERMLSLLSRQVASLERIEVRQVSIDSRLEAIHRAFNAMDGYRLRSVDPYWVWPDDEDTMTPEGVDQALDEALAEEGVEYVSPGGTT